MLQAAQVIGSVLIVFSVAMMQAGRWNPRSWPFLFCQISGLSMSVGFAAVTANIGTVILQSFLLITMSASAVVKLKHHRS